jgi:hypothetical protein
MDALTPVRSAPCRRGLGQCLPGIRPFGLRGKWAPDLAAATGHPPQTRTGLMASCTWPCADVPSPITRGARPSLFVLADALFSVTGSCHRPRRTRWPRMGFAIQLQARRHHPAESSSSSYGPSVHFRLLSTSPRGDAVTFSYKSENMDLKGTFTPRTQYTCHRTVAGHVAGNFAATYSGGR